jgi:hypothetical protein
MKRRIAVSIASAALCLGGQSFGLLDFGNGTE